MEWTPESTFRCILTKPPGSVRLPTMRQTGPLWKRLHLHGVPRVSLLRLKARGELSSQVVVDFGDAAQQRVLILIFGR